MDADPGDSGVAGTAGFPGIDAGGTGGALVDAPVDAPVVDAPVIDAPVIDAPVIDALVIDAPVIDAPVIDAPVIDAPVIDAPAIPPPMGADAGLDVAADLVPEAPLDVGNETPEAGAVDLLASKLVGYWKFDEGMGTIARDSSGKGNDATLHNAVGWTQGTTNLPPIHFSDPSAIDFKGTAYATAGTTSLPTTDASQTLSAWIYLRSTAGGDQYILCLWNQSSSNAVALGIHAGQVAAWKWGPSVLVAMAPPATNSWHHVAYTFDGVTHKLYLDGAPPATGAATPNAATVTTAEIATFNGGSLFNGQMDDLRIYNVALTASQVATLAAGNSP